jgi:hypothetical protein
VVSVWEERSTSPAVVVAADGDVDFVIDDLVDQSVFIGDAARPVAVKSVFERFWFPDAFVAVVVDILDQSVDPLEDLCAREDSRCATAEYSAHLH